MSLQPGQEFKLVATPTPELQRKLAYLAEVDNDSVLSGHAGARPGDAASARKSTSIDGAVEMMQMLEQQRARAQQIQNLNDRLDVLDRASAQALRDAKEHLEEIRHTANRTRDGRIVFEDENGTVRDENGDVVDVSEIDPDTWKPAGPTWEEFQAGLQDVADATDKYEQVQDLKEQIVGEPTDEELAEIGSEIAAFEGDMPASVAGAYHTSPPRYTSAAKLYDDQSSSELSLQLPFASATSPAESVEIEPPIAAPGKPHAPG